jgi:hypothetical protein
MNPLKRGRGDNTPERNNENRKRKDRDNREEGRVKTHVRIAAFNVNGLSGKIDDCVKLIQEQKLEMLFILETWLKEAKEQKHRQVITYLSDNKTKLTRGKHGVALMVPREMLEKSKEWTIITDEQDRAYIIVKTAGYTAAGIYLAPSLAPQTWHEILKRMHQQTKREDGRPVVWIGDLNARHTQMGDRVNNARGLDLQGMLTELGMARVRPESDVWTFQHSGSGSRSIVDLVLGNARDIEEHGLKAKVLTKADRAGSDHRPIMATLETSRSEVAFCRPKTYSYRLSKSVDLKNAYQEKVERELCRSRQAIELSLRIASDDRSRMIGQEEIDELYTETTQTIVRVCTSVCHQRPQAPATVFATPELKQLRHDRRVLQKTLEYMKRGVSEHRQLIVESLRLVQRKIRDITQALRWEKFQEFTRKFSKMNSSEKMRTLKAMYRTRLGQRTKLDSGKIEEYGEHFKQIYTETDEETSMSDGRTETGLAERILAANTIFTADEIKRALGHMANGKAPGVSNVSSEMLKYGGEAIVRILEKMFKLCYITGKIPWQWKTAMITLVAKKGDTSRVENNRPISITEVPRRAFERCLERKLKNTMKPLNIVQGGFRDRRSCYDQIAVLNEIAIEAHAKDRAYLYAFLDIKAAYDTVDRTQLWPKCATFGIRRTDVEMLQILFDYNEAKVVLAGHESRPFRLGRGLLQGSTLSPLLYSIFIDEMLEQMNTRSPVEVGETRISCLAYADDIAVIARTAEEMTEKLMVAEAYAKKHRFEFAPQKCELLTSQQGIVVKLQGTPLKQVEVFTYLGIGFTQEGIAMEKHITRMCEKATQTKYALQRMGMNLGGFDTVTNSQTYKCFIRSKMEYGVAMMPLRKNTEIAELNKTQNESLRSILGLWRGGCDREVMRSLTHVEDMETRAIILRARWLAEIANKDDSFLVYHGLKMHQEGRYGKKNSSFHITEHTKDAIGELSRRVRDTVTPSEMRRHDVRRWAWKQTTKAWRDEVRERAIAKLTPRFQALHQCTYRMLGQAHAMIETSEKRRIILWISKNLPSRPRHCLTCGGTKKQRIDHFGTHEGEIESINLACRDAARIARENRKGQANKAMREKLVYISSRVQQLERHWQ